MQMFSSRRNEPAKPATEPEKPAATPAPSNRATPTAQLGGVLSSSVSIVGTVKFRNELLIDGEVEGKIDSTGRLTIGKNGRIRGEIRTKSVIVEGTVDGNVTARERCELRAGCTMRGDIEAPRLVVDDAATFIGSAKIATQANRPA